MALHRFRVTGVVYVFRHRRNALRHRFIGDDISVDAIAEVDGKIAVSFLGLWGKLALLNESHDAVHVLGGRTGIEKFVKGVLDSTGHILHLRVGRALTEREAGTGEVGVQGIDGIDLSAYSPGAYQ